jgi:capsular polysaccharide biosynthesis protein
MRKSLLIIGGWLFIIAGFFTAITAPLVVFILPESFASTARILPGVTEPASLAREQEKIQSKSILFPVITNLNLNKIWAQKFKEEGDLPTEVTYAILKGSKLEVRQARKTLLIEITVYSDDKNEAAMIANAIATVYQRSDLATKSPDGKSAVQILDKAEPGLRPVRPNKPLDITIGCAIGVVIGALGVGLLRFSRNRG